MRAADQPKIQLSCAPDGGANYRAAVAGAGGLPGAGYCPAPDLTCDGLILCGGGDIHCAQYGQEDRGSHPPDLERDRAELALFRAFFAAGKPILGICRGLQLINVALGGTLIQDLPRALRDLHTSPQGDLVHTVRARPGSLLHRLYGPDFSVNSAHHQAIDRLGEGLTVSAWAEQDIPEAHLCRPIPPGADVLCPPPPGHGGWRGRIPRLCGDLPGERPGLTFPYTYDTS